MKSWKRLRRGLFQKTRFINVFTGRRQYSSNFPRAHFSFTTQFQDAGENIFVRESLKLLFFRCRKLTPTFWTSCIQKSVKIYDQMGKYAKLRMLYLLSVWLPYSNGYLRKMQLIVNYPNGHGRNCDISDFKRKLIFYRVSLPSRRFVVCQKYFHGKKSKVDQKKEETWRVTVKHILSRTFSDFRDIEFVFFKA